MGDTGLTQVPRTERSYQRHQEWGFSEGDVRGAFQRVYSPGREYVLFHTIANEEAAKALRGYIAFRKRMGSPWEVRELREGDNPAYVPGARNNGNGLQFDPSLMDSYLRAIDRIAGERLGEGVFSHYSMVATDRVHSLDRDPKAIFWPRTFMVGAEGEEGMKAVIDDLSGAESLEVLRDLESPQFYQMAEIETLHRLGIAPLVRLPKELRVGADELARNIDFLSQMREGYRWTGPVIDAD